MDLQPHAKGFGAALDLHSGDTVTTGATVTLTDPTYGHIERTFTVVCPGDLDADVKTFFDLEKSFIYFTP